MKNKYNTPLLLFYVIILITASAFGLRYFAGACDGFVIGDWLINFDDGFVRRGLSGFLILGFSDLLALKPNFTVMWVQILITISYLVTFFFLISRKKIDIWLFILLLSPATLLFPIFQPHSMGRKEIILFLLFTLYLLCLNKKLLRFKVVVFLFSFALLLATLFHELIFFYLPYFVIASFAKSKLVNEPFYFETPLIIITGSLLVIMPLFFYGKTINGSVICSGLIERGLSENICHGVITWPDGYDILDNVNYALSNEYHVNYSIAIILGLAPFLLLITYSENIIIRISLWKYFVVFCLLFLFSLPLFLMSRDWGRWINIHLMLLLLSSTLLLVDKHSKSNGNWSQEYLKIPSLWKSNTGFSVFSGKMVFLLIWALYITGWHMNISANFSIFSMKFFSVLSRVAKFV
jgi:hypothetical protein